MLTIARASRQLPLLEVAPDWTADSNATARNAYGMAAQQIVCDRLGLLPIPINGNFDCCFDAEKDGTFFEIKSVHKSGKLVIYDFRIEKEQCAGIPVRYAILVHTLRGARDRIHSRLLAASLCILVLPVAFVAACTFAEPLRVPVEKECKFRAGFTRGGYARGYRNVPLKRLLSFYTVQSF